jgi:hypothetical protein
MQGDLEIFKPLTNGTEKYCLGSSNRPIPASTPNTVYSWLHGTTAPIDGFKITFKAASDIYGKFLVYKR